jgi:hypothetical protein
VVGARSLQDSDADRVALEPGAEPARDGGPARDVKLARTGIGVLLAGAIAVRTWLMLDYGPAFLGFGDSHEYVTAATLGVFHDVQKPAGYPIFRPRSPTTTRAGAATRAPPPPPARSTSTRAARACRGSC